MLDELGISNEQLSGGSRRGALLGDISFVTIQYTGSRKGKRCPLITRTKTQRLPILYIIYAGKAVMIISHDLNEMMEQCSTLTVLRDGVIIDNIEKENFDPDDIKQKMVGREIKGHYYRVDNDGYSDEVVLKADCITTMESLLCFDLELHKQEILGIGGLSDCGMVFSLANKNARENA